MKAPRGQTPSGNRRLERQLAAVRADLEAANQKLAQLEPLLPDLQRLAADRRLAEQGRAWLASFMPRPARRWAGRISTAVISGLLLFGFEHGWIGAIIKRLVSP
jgi:hypothetical protein